MFSYKCSRLSSKIVSRKYRRCIKNLNFKKYFPISDPKSNPVQSLQRPGCLPMILLHLDNWSFVTQAHLSQIDPIINPLMTPALEFNERTGSLASHKFKVGYVTQGIIGRCSPTNCSDPPEEKESYEHKWHGPTKSSDANSHKLSL